MSRLLIGCGIAALAANSAAPASAAQPLIASQFPARILASHNAVRASVGVPPLAWDNALGNSAAAYAQRLALTNVFQHSDRKSRPGVGENLWMGTRGAYSLETMVGGWASERRYFVPGIFPNNSTTGNWIDVGHYTQMIWPSVQRVGCAVAANARTEYLVCHYSPKGNIDGKWVGPGRAERG
ncbi:MAG TPA: CAP domain-containing protein [Sphingomicrobium sp.]|jgi:hypothetical protein